MHHHEMPSEISWDQVPEKWLIDRNKSERMNPVQIDVNSDFLALASPSNPDNVNESFFGPDGNVLEYRDSIRYQYEQYDASNLLVKLSNVQFNTEYFTQLLNNSYNHAILRVRFRRPLGGDYHADLGGLDYAKPMVTRDGNHILALTSINFGSYFTPFDNADSSPEVSIMPGKSGTNANTRSFWVGNLNRSEYKFTHHGVGNVMCEKEGAPKFQLTWAYEDPLVTAKLTNAESGFTKVMQGSTFVSRESLTEIIDSKALYEKDTEGMLDVKWVNLRNTIPARIGYSQSESHNIS